MKRFSLESVPRKHAYISMCVWMYWLKFLWYVFGSLLSWCFGGRRFLRLLSLLATCKLSCNYAPNNICWHWILVIFSVTLAICLYLEYVAESPFQSCTHVCLYSFGYCGSTIILFLLLAREIPLLSYRLFIYIAFNAYYLFIYIAFHAYS